MAAPGGMIIEPISFTAEQVERRRGPITGWLIAHQGWFFFPYCVERGVPYTQTGLIESYAIVVRYINRVGLGERDPFECPMIAERAAF